MSWSVVVNGVDITAGVPAADDGFSVTESAEKGTTGTGGIHMDDPGAVANLPGLKDCQIEESASVGHVRIASGYLAMRRIGRNDRFVAGADRAWDVDFVDLNNIWRGGLGIQSGERPAETDIARITWLLGSGAIPSAHDHGLIDSTGPVSLPASDYTGKYPGDVMDDCANASGKNYFATIDDTTLDTTLAYHAGTSTLYSSTLRLANTTADIDASTTFAVDLTSQLSRDPSRVYSGVIVMYNGGSRYRHNATTATNFRDRDYILADYNISTAAAADAAGDAFLTRSALEEDRFTAQVVLPADKVGLLRAGMRVQVQLQHEPGYATWQWVRVVRRTVSPYNVLGGWLLRMELCNPIMLGGASGTGTVTVTPPITAASPPITANDDVTGACTVTISDPTLIVGEPTNPGAFELVGIGTGYAQVDSGGLGSNGCDVGQSRWSGGPQSVCRFYEITTSCKPPAAILLRWSGPVADAATDGVSNDFGFYAYLTNSVPVSFDEGQLLGVFHAADPLVIDIPASWLSASSSVYLLMSPVSRKVGGPFCLGNFQRPINAAADHAYGYNPAPGSGVTLTWQAIDGGQTGTADWLPAIEAANGSRVTFTLSGWDGTGSPQVAVNGLPANVASTDTGARTVTLSAPPPAGALVTARYHVVTA